MQAELEYVYRVYQEGSFSKAAEDLFISQPALSQAIRKVENSLGMPIFDRTVRPMVLTPAGEAYIEFIRNTQYLEQELRQQMQDFRDLNSGFVRIGGSHYINAYILPQLLSSFAGEHPGIRIEIVENSSAFLSQMLGRRELDVTFNCNPNFMQNFERYPAFEDHILLAVPNSLALPDALRACALTSIDVSAKRHLRQDCPCVTLDAFRNLDFILLASGNNLHDRAKQLFQEAGFHPNIKLELSQLVTAYRMANASLGATFVSDRLVPGEADNLRYFKLDSELTTRDFYMLLPNRKYTSRAVHAFIDHCICSL